MKNYILIILMFLTYYSIISGFYNSYRKVNLDNLLLSYIELVFMPIVFLIIKKMFLYLTNNSIILPLTNFILKFYFLLSIIYFFSVVNKLINMFEIEERTPNC